MLGYGNDIPNLEVKATRSIKNLETFNDIIVNGSKDDILKFVKEKNILNSNIFEFSKIYWLLREDKEFYEKFVEILKERAIFDLNSKKTYKNSN